MSEGSSDPQTSKTQQVPSRWNKKVLCFDAPWTIKTTNQQGCLWDMVGCRKHCSVAQTATRPQGNPVLKELGNRDSMTNIPEWRQRRRVQWQRKIWKQFSKQREKEAGKRSSFSKTEQIHGKCNQMNNYYPKLSKCIMWRFSVHKCKWPR